MAKRYIILQGVSGYTGSGVASLCGGTITVSITGTSEEHTIYFMSARDSNIRINAGTIRGGCAKSFELKPEDADHIDSVILVKDGSPVITGTLAPFLPEFKEEPGEERKKKDNKSPLGIDDGFNWLKIEDGRFAENIPIIRYIFENINVISRINKYGYYMYGTNGGKSAVAIFSEQGETNPFVHLEDCARKVNGYWVVCADKKEKYFYSIID
ncbi:MAG: hypothetical protein Q8882_04110 [Bacillota bacterium]|nr:hypothetical protein [Bacillota bacterium]